MGHNLNMKNGKAAMMYVGEKPWHSLGTQLQNVATSAEAIVAAQMDWNVEKRQVHYPAGKTPGTTRIYQGKYVTVRADNERALGIVGERYTVLSNKSAFSFFDAVVGSKEAMYHTCGALGAGEKVWILAKLPGNIKVTKEDVVEKYLLLTNSHDGSSAIEMLWTPIRVVCENTLNMALSSEDKSQRMRIRHTASVGMKLEDVREKLGIINYQYTVFEEMSQRLLKVQMNQKDFSAFLEKVGVVTRDEDGKLSGRAKNTMETVIGLYEHGKGTELAGVKGTGWGAVNAVVEYVDYLRGTDENRTESLLYGSGAVMKQKAWDSAIALVK
jgi:phage/plasmid-like protein (TIGR03299 family)